jgi:arginase
MPPLPRWDGTDLNPPEESDGALDWTGVAHILDVPGAARQLANLGPRRPLLAQRSDSSF